MFYVAEVLLATLELSYSSHAAVLAAYGREFAKTDRLNPKFHRWLLDASDARIVGDYEIEPEISAAEARRVCEQCRRISQRRA